MPILELTSHERSGLRAAAHPLKPVVLIGDKGLSAAVLKEIDRALTAHGLIKVRAGSEDRDGRDAMLAEICAALSCAPVHHLGKTLILYRPGSDKYQDKPAPRATDASPAKRKASEPHTPKKMAAEGKKLTKTPRRAARSEPEKKTFAAAKNTPVKRANSGGKTAAPRKTTGSALSLRAGARRMASPARKAVRAFRGKT